MTMRQASAPGNAAPNATGVALSAQSEYAAGSTEVRGPRAMEVSG